jgi:RNA polymerase sigma factor (TIGR02999 family)
MTDEDGSHARAAVDESTGLFQDVYSQLKVIASRQRYKAGAPASLCTTEIVHEVFLKMDGGEGLRFDTNLQFFAYAARAMRHVLVDLARRRMNMKDGGDLVRVPMNDLVIGAVTIDPGQALELDTALRALEHDSPRAAQVVELHYFAGLPMERVAELLDCSTRTVDRSWRYARSFLALQMNH